MPKKGFKSITISEELFMEIGKIQKSYGSYKNKADVISIAIQLLSEKLENTKNMKKQNRKNHSRLKTCPWCGIIHAGEFPVCDPEREEIVKMFGP